MNTEDFEISVREVLVDREKMRTKKVVYVRDGDLGGLKENGNRVSMVSENELKGCSQDLHQDVIDMLDIMTPYFVGVCGWLHGTKSASVMARTGAQDIAKKILFGADWRDQMPEFGRYSIVGVLVDGGSVVLTAEVEMATGDVMKVKTPKIHNGYYDHFDFMDELWDSVNAFMVEVGEYVDGKKFKGYENVQLDLFKARIMRMG